MRIMIWALALAGAAAGCEGSKSPAPRQSDAAAWPAAQPAPKVVHTTPPSSVVAPPERPAPAIVVAPKVIVAAPKVEVQEVIPPKVEPAPVVVAEVPRPAAAMPENAGAIPPVILPLPELRPLDAARAAAAGLRHVDGERLVLYTDLPPSAEIDSLPEVFGQAYPQWCRYFQRPELIPRVWRMHGYLMQDKARFTACGALPKELPSIRHGFAAGMDLWLYEQPSTYYRRHLLLHEGTHAFMHTNLGGIGPPWYAEGMAELLATHSDVAGKVTLDYFPKNREEVSQLGRIKLVRDTIAGGRLLSIDAILDFGPGVHVENEPYAWCWALAALLDNHASFRDRFRTLPREVNRLDFNAHFRQLYAADWHELNDTWEVYASQLEHDYDFARAAIEFAPGKPLPSAGGRVKVAADRCWQSSGIQLEAGKKYRLRAAGRYQVASQPKIWWCEPGGVTIRYYAGQPLGILLAAVRPDERLTNEISPLVHPQAIGLGATIEPQQSGTLYLRINDSPAELADNSGTLDVEIAAE